MIQYWWTKNLALLNRLKVLKKMEVLKYRCRQSLHIVIMNTYRAENV
jgi:hypothetical protein